MNVLTLLGSPRPKGNTAAVLSWVEDELAGLGHRVEHIDLARLKINGCLGCAKCREHPDRPACVQEDDAGPLLDKMIKAEAVVFASPLYFWGFSAQMKAFLDRGYSLVVDYGRPGHASLVEGQRQALLVTAADEYENNGEEIVTSFRRIADYAKARPVGELFVGGCTTPDRLSPEVRDRARDLARRLVEQG